jgi:hypothetical protein
MADDNQADSNESQLSEQEKNNSIKMRRYCRQNRDKCFLRDQIVSLNKFFATLKGGHYDGKNAFVDILFLGPTCDLTNTLYPDVYPIQTDNKYTIDINKTISSVKNDERGTPIYTIYFCDFKYGGKNTLYLAVTVDSFMASIQESATVNLFSDRVTEEMTMGVPIMDVPIFEIINIDIDDEYRTDLEKRECRSLNTDLIINKSRFNDDTYDKNELNNEQKEITRKRTELQCAGGGKTRKRIKKRLSKRKKSAKKRKSKRSRR